MSLLSTLVNVSQLVTSKNRVQMTDFLASFHCTRTYKLGFILLGKKIHNRPFSRAILLKFAFYLATLRKETEVTFY